MANFLQNTDANVFVSTDSNVWVGLPVEDTTPKIRRSFRIVYGDKPLLIKRVLELYHDAAVSVKRLELPLTNAATLMVQWLQRYEMRPPIFLTALEYYGDAPIALKKWDELYQPYPEVKKSFNQFFGEAIGVVRKIDQIYSSFPAISKAINQSYEDAVVTVGLFNQRYGEYNGTLKAYELPYIMPSQVQNAITEPYTITQSDLLSVFDCLYDLDSLNKVVGQVLMPYYLLAGSVITYTPNFTMTIGGEVYDFIDLRLSISLNQYCFIAEIQLADQAAYQSVSVMDDVQLSIDGEGYNLFIESKYKDFDLEERKYTIMCLSPTAKLDKPYSVTQTKTYASDVLASDVVNEMADYAGVTVDYQLVDWLLDSSVFYVQDETPMEVIRKVVSSVGGVIQTKPNGDLLIISSYPVSPTQWSVVVPDSVINIDEEVFTIVETPVVNQGYNAFIITNEEAVEHRIWLERRFRKRGEEEVRGFRVPFADGPFNLEASRGLPVTIEREEYYVDMAIPELEYSGDEEWEYIEFIDWEGRSNYPIYSILEYEWVGDDLGTFSFSEDGRLFVNSVEVPSEGLLRMKYVTRFWRWKVKGPVDSYVQVFVPKLQGE